MGKSAKDKDRVYLNVEQVARRFGVNPSTIYRLLRRGTFPGFKVGGQWRVSSEMLEGWVADRVSVERLKANGPAFPTRVT